MMDRRWWLFALLAACSRSRPLAPREDAAWPSPSFASLDAAMGDGALVPEAAEDASGDAPLDIHVRPTVTYVPWKDHGSGKDESNFPYPFPIFQGRGFPAVSGDGKRVAYLYSDVRVGRSPGDREHSVLLFDVLTGRARRLPLWTLADTPENWTVPPPDPYPPLDLLAKTDRLLAARAQAANAALDGDWVTLGSLERMLGFVDPDAQASGDYVFGGAGLKLFLRITKDGPVLDVTADDGTPSTRRSTRDWRTHVDGCPPQSGGLHLIAAYAGGHPPVVAVVTDPGLGVPDGCEKTTVHVFALPSRAGGSPPSSR
jgi:hypothetical protein